MEEQFVQRYSGRRDHMIQSGKMQVDGPREAGKTKRANEGDKNCSINIPRDQKEAFPRALKNKRSHSF